MPKKKTKKKVTSKDQIGKGAAKKATKQIESVKKRKKDILSGIMSTVRKNNK